jgi:hypothetical protein
LPHDSCPPSPACTEPNLPQTPFLAGCSKTLIIIMDHDATNNIRHWELVSGTAKSALRGLWRHKATTQGFRTWKVVRVVDLVGQVPQQSNFKFREETLWQRQAELQLSCLLGPLMGLSACICKMEN